MGPFQDGWTEADVEAAIARNDPAELLYAPIVVSMDPPDCEWAESVCVRLAVHPNPRVRANAILGFGHLARTCRKLNKPVVRPLVESGLNDPAPEVRGQAEAAVMDLQTFLGWTRGV
jgi:hypothetical protein